MKTILTSPQRRGRRGMVLMEILCAIMIFGMAALGLMRALTVSAQNAIISSSNCGCCCGCSPS